MNILLDPMPDFLEVCKHKIPIDSGFRTWIRFDEALFWSDEPMESRIYSALQICYGDKIPLDVNAAIHAAIAFYAHTDKPFENIREEQQGIKEKTTQSNRTYSFIYDAPLICAAFLSQYCIDLTKDNLHWLHFKALFEGLTDDNKICKVMEIRGMDLSKVKDKETKAHYRTLKRLYRLPDPRSEQEQEEDMMNALAVVF